VVSDRDDREDSLMRDQNDERDDESRPSEVPENGAEATQTDALISALIDGALDPSEASSLRERMAGDPALAERQAAFERLDGALRALPAPDVPADLAVRMRAKIADEQRAPLQAASVPTHASGRRRSHRTPRRTRYGWPSVAAAGMATAAAALAFYLTLPSASPRPSSQPEAVPVSLLASAGDDELVIALYYDELADLEMLEQLELLEALAAIEEAEQG
jgi:negative regulator of sigma E activity